MDMTAAVADHNEGLDLAVPACAHGAHRGDEGDIQASRAVGIDRICPEFASWRCEFGRRGAAPVVALCQVAVAVEALDAFNNPDGRGGW